jgi:hypothetical protein
MVELPALEMVPPVLKGKEEAKSQLTALEFPVTVVVDKPIAPELIAKSFNRTSCR